MVTISGSVGKGGMNKIKDVAIIQAALINQKQPKKPYWQGQIDGKNGSIPCKKVEDAIRQFQCDHKLPKTGLIKKGSKDFRALVNSIPAKYHSLTAYKNTPNLYLLSKSKYIKPKHTALPIDFSKGIRKIQKHFKENFHCI